jgi:LacI family transcriptional regulator
VTNRRSAQDATKHLVGHGLRRIVAIGARPQLYTCKERISGYKAGMKLASLSPRLCLVEHEDLLTPEWLTEEVLRKQDADAILTLNWVCTMRTLRGLRQLRRIPGSDIPLFSFDDFDLADMLTPALSVVQQPAEMLGREAARLLFGRLKGNEKNSQAVVLDTNLIIRQSCGCQDSSR